MTLAVFGNQTIEYFAKDSYIYSHPTKILPIHHSPFLAALVVVASIFIAMSSTAANAEASGDAYAASCTSCYTTEEKKDSYSTLSNLLETKCANGLVRQVISDMMAVCADITDALRVNLVTVEGSANVFGDSQLSVDVRDQERLSIWELRIALESTLLD